MTSELRRLIDLEIEQEVVEEILPIKMELERKQLETMFETEHEIIRNIKSIILDVPMMITTNEFHDIVKAELNKLNEDFRND